MDSFSRGRLFLLAAVLALPAGARADGAEQPAGAPPDQPAAPVQQLQQAQPPDAPFGAAAADDLLARARGGTGVTTINTRLSGTVSGNSANHVTTGANVIQGGSFANMSGIPIIVQNTGANVLIQNATVINLQFK